MKASKRVKSLNFRGLAPSVVSAPVPLARAIAVPPAPKPPPRPPPSAQLSDEPIVDALVASFGRIALELRIGPNRLLQVLLERPYLFLRALLRARNEFAEVNYAQPVLPRPTTGDVE